IRIVEEITSSKLYRSAKVELLDDLPFNDADAEAKLRRQFIDLAPRLFPQAGDVKAEFRKVLLGANDLGVLADIITFALPLDTEFKQEMLAEVDVHRRAMRLAAHLEAKAPPASGEHNFPPNFSAN